ncbi:MAG: hypothetical protein FWF50_01705, partial [Defluviitaleaceae bacterium]|nr:hypothetical protein [Defluviitaleaceae bacterium]
MKKFISFFLAIHLMASSMPLNAINFYESELPLIYERSSKYIEDTEEERSYYRYELEPLIEIPQEELNIWQETENEHNLNEWQLDLNENQLLAEQRMVNTRINQQLNQEIVTLNFVNVPEESRYNLILRPTYNTRQRQIFQLTFSPLSENIYEPGEIEIRLPYALFQNRVGEYIISPSPMEIPLPGLTAFSYTIDSETNEIIIRNHASVVGSGTQLIVNMAFNYMPSLTANGFTNEFYAKVSFAERHNRESLRSRPISFELETRVIPNMNLGKTNMAHYSDWQPIWGAEPANNEYINSYGYFFVRYRIRYTTVSRILNFNGVNQSFLTTQPFTVQLIENPLNGGEIVAWSNIFNGMVSNPSSWTIGNTEAFNRWAEVAWDVSTPSAGIEQVRNINVIVRYPRPFPRPITEEQEPVIVGNEVSIIFNPIDSEKIVINSSSSHRYITHLAPTPEADLFSISSNMGRYTGLPHINPPLHYIINGFSFLEGGFSTQNIFRTVTANIRGFSHTKNGTRPFKTIVTNEYFYLRTLSGENRRLNEADFTIVSANISNYQETRPVFSEINGEILATGIERIAGVHRSPIRVYIERGHRDWEYHVTLFENAISNIGNISNLPQNTTRIRAVHSNGLYHVSFLLNLTIILNPTENVLSMLENQETINLFNGASLEVLNYFGTQINSYRFHESYAHLTRVTFFSQINKFTRGNWASQSAYGRFQIPYRLVFQHNTEGGNHRLPEEVFVQILPEQTSGVFYDLLPSGAILDTSRIRAIDILGREAEYRLYQHHNWQGSGRTLIAIYVQVSDNYDTPNLRNSHLSFGGLGIGVWGGTGFAVDFYVFYPWLNLRFFGNQLRNLASYQSRSGELFYSLIQGSRVHTNANNTATQSQFNARERELMANFPNTYHIYVNERNTVSTALTTSVDVLTSDQLGFRSYVRSSSSSIYSEKAQVYPSEAYFYRFQFIPPEDAHATSEIMEFTIFNVLEIAHYGEPHWQGTLTGINSSQPRNMANIENVVYYISTVTGLDPFKNEEHSNLSNTAIWSRVYELPENTETITAVAIRMFNNNSSILTGNQNNSIVVYLEMEAPATQKDGYAFNRASYQIIARPLGGGELFTTPMVQAGTTRVSFNELVEEEKVEEEKDYNYEKDEEDKLEKDYDYEENEEEDKLEKDEEEKLEEEPIEPEAPQVTSSQIRILTINPHNNSNHFFARWFEEWVNGKGGSNQRFSKNINLNPLNAYGNPTIIFEQVTTYELSRNPNHKKFVDIETLLRDEYGNYRFDIIAIGSWDYGGILRPGNEPHIIQAVSDFMDAGGAVIFGHDTLTDRHRTSHGRGSTAQTTFGTAHGTLQDGEFYRNRLNRLYGMNYLFAPLAHRAGIIPSQRVDRFAHHSNTANRKFAIITEQGPLTSFPFNFEVGQIIPISATHNNGSLTRGTVWA